MTHIPSPSGIRIAIVDDDMFVRASMRRYLSSFPDFHFAGEAASALEALELVQVRPVDVLLLDANMPGTSGIEVLPHLRRSAPGVQVVVLSADPASRAAPAALRAGACAYLEKPVNPERINRAIRSAAAARTDGAEGAVSKGEQQ